MRKAEEVMADFEKKLKSGELIIEHPPGNALDNSFREYLKENNLRKESLKGSSLKKDFLGEPMDD